MSEDLDAAAREIIDSNLYMTLGTADREGRPWASPVYFAHGDYASFLWVSSPETTHSDNLLARPELEISSRRVVGHGGQAFTHDDLLPPARRRLYRAAASEHFILDSRDRRLPVSPDK